MLPGQEFDESRLVKPGEWDSLAGGDEDHDAAMAELTGAAGDLESPNLRSNVVHDVVNPHPGRGVETPGRSRTSCGEGVWTSSDM